MSTALTHDQFLQHLVEALPSVPASSLKNDLGRVFEMVKEQAVAVTRHKRPQFVMVPVAEYQELQRARLAPLEALAAEFDSLVAEINTPTAKTGAARLFTATPKALGRAAVKAAGRHGR